MLPLLFMLLRHRNGFLEFIDKAVNNRATTLWFTNYRADLDLHPCVAKRYDIYINIYSGRYFTHGQLSKACTMTIRLMLLYVVFIYIFIYVTLYIMLGNLATFFLCS